MKKILGFLFIVFICIGFNQDNSRNNELVNWHKSLDLAYPEDIEFKLELERAILFEGQPILVRCLIINKRSEDITVIPPPHRLRSLVTNSLGFNIINGQNIDLPYQLGFHARSMFLPGDEKVIGPHDSLYINMILWSNNFYKWENRNQGTQKLLFLYGEYKLYGQIFLGVKWYPKPSRDILLFSDTVNIRINTTNAADRNWLIAAEPLICAFFYKVENGLLFDESLYVEAVPILEEIRKGNSNLAPLIDFVSISIEAVTRNGNIDPVIDDAKNYIAKNKGSILAEEMEFVLLSMLHKNNEYQTVFVKEANRISAEYSKNINVFTVNNWLEEK